MSADPQQRVQELERQRDEINSELDELYTQLAGDEDTWAMALANRFMRERDDARREAAALKAQLASFNSDWEARFRAVEARFLSARDAIGRVTNAPLMPRDQVQSVLLLAYERIRDFSP